MRTEGSAGTRAHRHRRNAGTEALRHFPKLYLCGSSCPPADFSVDIYSYLRGNLCRLSGSRSWGGQGAAIFMALRGPSADS